MKPFSKVHIQYNFELDSLLKIGAGYGENSFIDNKMRGRYHMTKGYIFDVPGTSVKGRIRANFEKIESIVSIDSNSIFGQEHIEGWAHFSALTSKKPMQVGISTSTAIDRYRKSAKQKSLRVEEFVQAAYNDELIGTIDGYIANDIEGQKQLYALLLALLRTDCFGGDKSIGYGKGTLRIQKLMIDEQKIDLTNIKEKIIEKLVI